MAFMAFYGDGDAVNIKRRRLKQAMTKQSGYNQLIYSRHENAEVCGIDRAKYLLQSHEASTTAETPKSLLRIMLLGSWHRSCY